MNVSFELPPIEGEAVVLQSPSEVIEFKGSVAILVHGQKDSGEASDTVRSTVAESLFDITKEISSSFWLVEK